MREQLAHDPVQLLRDASALAYQLLRAAAGQFVACLKVKIIKTAKVPVVLDPLRNPT